MNNCETDPGQPIERPLKQSETDFINKVAIPMMDKNNDEKSLAGISATFWDLCLWEKNRSGMIDTKASYLLGLSSIVGAVIAIGGTTQDIASPVMMWIGGLSLGLFAVAVIVSLIALLGRKCGGFNDRDVFYSLIAYEGEGGKIIAFADKDPHRCFLKETALQRWLIYRWHCEGNDAKFKWLRRAQVIAVLAVIFLFVFLALTIYSKC